MIQSLAGFYLTLSLSYLFIYSNFVLFLWRGSNLVREAFAVHAAVSWNIFQTKNDSQFFSAKPHTTTLEHTTMEDRTHYFGHLVDLSWIQYEIEITKWNMKRSGEKCCSSCLGNVGLAPIVCLFVCLFAGRFGCAHEACRSWKESEKGKIKTADFKL